MISRLGFGKNRTLIFFSTAGFVVALAMLQIHVRVNTTLIGYRIGELKDEEALLLEERSHLKMELLKLTTRSHLEQVAKQAYGNADNVAQGN